jgi:hypothetical protein
MRATIAAGRRGSQIPSKTFTTEDTAQHWVKRMMMGVTRIGDGGHGN